jgi:hypothetical protein
MNAGAKDRFRIGDARLLPLLFWDCRAHGLDHDLKVTNANVMAGEDIHLQCSQAGPVAA